MSDSNNLLIFVLGVLFGMSITFIIISVAGTYPAWTSKPEFKRKMIIKRDEEGNIESIEYI